MDISFDTHDGVTVARPRGRLDFAAAAEFQKSLEQAIAARPRALVLDCAGLEYVSSAGLRALLVAARAAKGASAAFCACALVPGVREVFDVSGFSRIIDVQTDLAAALAKVSPAA